MTDRPAIRQRAVDDARVKTRHSGVQVYHRVEVNLVRKAMAGRPSIATACFRRLIRIFRSKPGVPLFRRVFIGKYGFHANAAKPATVRDQYERSRQVMRAALEPDLPFALIWRLYNNEFAPDGTSKEMGLIDAQGQKRALFHLPREYLSAMREFVTATCRRTGGLPPRAQFRTRAIEGLDGLPSDRLQRDANSKPPPFSRRRFRVTPSDQHAEVPDSRA